jgi:ankyrin repeat protein
MLDIPTEILWIIAGTLKVGEVSAFARTNRKLYHTLRPVLIEYNIKNHKSSALHLAAKTDNCAYAKTLLSYGANVNALVDGLSPLMTAAEHNSEQVTQLLLKNRKLHVNKRNGEGKTALWHGVANKSSAAVHRLLQHRRIEIDRSNREGQTVLWLAVTQEDRDLVSRLLAQGANPETKDQGGISPWIEACLRNRPSIKDLFLDHCKATSPITFSSDMAPSRNEETVLSAASNGDLATLRKLLLRGEEVDVVNHQGQTPLHLAARGGHLAVVDVLLRQANSLLNRKDHHDRTALWFSTYSSYDGVTKRLLEEGDVDAHAWKEQD